MEEERKSEDGEDFSIDLSKVKGFLNKFRKKGGEAAKGSGESEEFSLNMASAWKFLLKYKTVFLILIPILFMIYFRSFPNYLPATDDWAKSAVVNNVKSNIMSQINAQYPNLPDAQKSELADAQFNEMVKDKSQRQQIDGQIKEVSNYFKSSFKDDKGYTYLADIDSYIWMRYARNILKNGHPGDKLVNGKPYDALMYAPLGTQISPDLYSYIEAYLYKFVFHPFNKKITLMQTAFYTPFFLSIIAIIAAFFIARRISGDFGGFMAAMIIAIHPFFLSRTFGSDNDVINVVFPLVILWIFLESFEAKKRINAMILAGVTGLLIGIYSFAWGGWWYIFDFIIAALVVYAAYHLITHRKELKNGLAEYFKKTDIKDILIIFLILIVSSGIFVTLFTDFTNFSNAPFNPIAFKSIKSATTADLWPNVYTTVAELNSAALSTIVASTGMSGDGKFFFFISLLGVALTLFKKDKNGKVDVKFAVLLAIWYFSTIYASRSGVRFILLLISVFSIAVGVAFGIVYMYAGKWISKGLHLPKLVSNSIVVVFLLLLLIAPLQAADRTSKQEFPIMNDAWYDSLTMIRDKSMPNAIINSWWDFGHYFKAIAERAVTFDGASQYTAQAHWIGKVLLTDNEEQAIAILRMLDCGANTAFEKIDKKLSDTSVSVDVVYKIIMMKKDGAKTYLMNNYNFNNDESDDVLKSTHCSPPEDYFITSDDMIGKSGVWAHFGSWDFIRAEMWINARGKSKEDAVKYLAEQKDFNLTKERAEQIYYEILSLKDESAANTWIAPWPSYAGSSGCSVVKNETISCDNGILINLTNNYEPSILTNDGIKKPAKFGYIDKSGNYIERSYDENTIPYGVVLVKSGDSYSTVMSNIELTSSIFTKLYFLEGKGTKHFDLFSDKRSITGGRMIVWKVNWEGRTNNMNANSTISASP
ncbi:hypothetical protein HYU07_04275 [Candidatus Woesearchaeota archaeon]|nr:hypothetical protein [Candidatus Woesearchaeota archaeon]